MQMKLKFGSLVWSATRGVVFFSAGAVQAQNRAPRQQQRQQQTGPYMESRQGYQTSPPAGCAGCTPEGQQAQAPRRQSRRPALVPNPLPYDLLLEDGHVIDAKNNIDRVTDVAIKDGKIAAVGDHLNAKDAAKAVDVKGYIVTPRLIDFHMPIYASPCERGSYAGDQSVWPVGV